MVSRALRELAFIACTLLVLTPFAAAQLTEAWTGNTNAIWGVNTNWVFNITPATTVSAVIDTNGSVQPIYTGSGSSSVANITVGNTSASGSNTELIIERGLTFDTLTIGNGTGSEGTVLMNGTFAQLALGRFLPQTSVIGGAGNGTLDISAGGNFTSGNGTIGNLAGSTGVASVDGSGTEWNLMGLSLNIGQSGNGTLSITNGGNVSSGVGAVGNLTGSNGCITVNGSGSVLSLSEFNTGQNLTIGGAGNGALSIANGGHVASGNGIVGNLTGAAGSVVVSGTNSVWLVGSTQFFPASLTVGDAGNGSVSITNGGNISGEIASAIIGNLAAANGSVVVDGSGSIWQLNQPFGASLIVGGQGNGSLTISNGGNVSGISSLIVGNQTGSNGTLTISGANSTLDLSNQLFNSGLFVGVKGNGTLNVDGGANLTANLVIGVNGTVNQSGGTVTDDARPNGGFQTNGTYNLDGGTLNLGSNQITGNGTFNLAGGTLQDSTGIINFNVALAAGTTSTISGNLSGLPYFFTEVFNAGTISGSGNLQLSGGGDAELAGNNTYTGATIVNGITLDAFTLANGGVASSIGASSNAASNLVINGGTLELGLQFGGQFSDFSTDRLFTIGGSGATIEGNTNFATISFTNSGALAFSSPSGTASTLALSNLPYIENSFAPLIGDNGPGGSTSVNLTGDWALSNANTYSGNTTVTNSTLTVDNTSGSATGTGNVVINGATSGSVIVGQLTGNGSIAGNVYINSGALLAPGAAGVGNLTIGSLSLAANTTLTFNFASGLSNTQVIITNPNGLTLNGSNVNLFNAADGSTWATLGNYTLFDVSGSVGGTGLAALSVNNPQPGLAYTFTDNGTAVQVDLANIAPTNNWSANGNGTWGNSANWSALAVPDGAGSIIGFANATAPTTVTLDANHIAGDLVFNSSNGDFTINATSGSGLSMNNANASARMDVVAGNATITAPITLTGNGLLSLVAANSTLTLSGNIGESTPATLTVGGNGTLVLAGNNTYSGGTVLNYGTLDLVSSVALGNGSLTINGGNLANSSGAALTLTGNNPQIWNASFGYLGPDDLDLGSNPIILGGSVSSDGLIIGGINLNVASGNLITNGNITGTSSLTKTGNGTLVVNGNDTDSAGISVYDGTLVLNGQVFGDGTLGDPNPSDNGTAAWIIQNGGTASGAFFSLYGSTANTTLLVTGAGSSLINTGFIDTPGGGSVVMTVANGGLISTPFLWLIGQNFTFNLQSGGILQFIGSEGIGLQEGSLALNLSGGTIQAATTGLNIAVNGTLADNTTTTIDTDGNATTYSGVLSGNGSLAIEGGGVLTLNAANTYLGATNIIAGTLALSGTDAIATSSAINLIGGNLDVSALNANSIFTFDPNQILAGSGTIVSNATGNLALNGTLAPGMAGPLIVSGGNVALNGFANFTLNDQSHYSQLSSTGALTYGGNLTLNLGNALFNGIYNLFSFGSQSGDFLGVNLTGLFAGALADSAGVWNTTESTEDFSFSDATGQLTVSDSFPPGTSATKQAWLQNNFSIAQLANAAVSGDNAAPAGDGIPNFFKYAFNLDALAYGSAGLPQPTVMNGNLVLSFTAQPDITYTVEASTDLVTWSTTSVTQQANGSQVTATYPLPPSGTAFLHVVVVPAP